MYDIINFLYIHVATNNSCFNRIRKHQREDVPLSINLSIYIMQLEDKYTDMNIDVHFAT